MAGLIISSLAGILGIILSVCLKKYKMTSLIAGFNPEKHDEDKVAKIVGDNLFLAGVLIIFFEIARVVAVEYINIIDIAEGISIIALVIKMIYDTNKYGLKEN